MLVFDLTTSFLGLRPNLESLGDSDNAATARFTSAISMSHIAAEYLRYLWIFSASFTFFSSVMEKENRRK